jgi:hypothetical protein
MLNSIINFKYLNMNFIKKGIFFLFAATVLVACSDDDDPVVVDPGTTDPVVSNHPLAGTSWSISSDVGSLVVAISLEAADADFSASVAGANDVEGTWWYFGQWGDDAAARACLLDDTYVFNDDNTFTQELGDDTWLEAWQEGVDAEACGAPLAPHNGSSAATWSADTSTVTIVGPGAFLGLAKVTNTSEDGAPVDNTTTYNYELSDDGNTLTLHVIGFGNAEATAAWLFKMTKN